MPYRNDGVGFRHTDTSHDAMPDEISATSMRGKVLLCIQERPRTCDEVATSTGISPFSVRPRICELQHAGWVFDSGQRRVLRSGKNGIVWASTPVFDAATGTMIGQFP